MRGPPREGERGYALVAAVASIIVFAALALAAATAARMSVVSASADFEQARASAAADAGLAIAIHGLLARDPRVLSALSGGETRLDYAGAAISVRIADDNGKVPLNRMDDARAERLLEQAGLSGEALATARDSLLDWLDDDDQARPDGAEVADYQRFGIAPRNGGLSSIDELVRVRGFTPAIVRRLRPYVTIDADAGAFDPRQADPRAIAVMEDDASGGAVDAIIRTREAAGQRAAFAQDEVGNLAHRPLTVKIEARTAGGAVARREAAVLLTHSPDRPYLIKSYR